MVQCIRIDGCLRTGRLAGVSRCESEGHARRTVDIHAVLLHEVPQVGKPRGGVDLHVGMECAIEDGVVEGAVGSWYIGPRLYRGEQRVAQDGS
jgi:hypothetical protein